MERPCHAEAAEPVKKLGTRLGLVQVERLSEPLGRRPADDRDAVVGQLHVKTTALWFGAEDGWFAGLFGHGLCAQLLEHLKRALGQLAGAFTSGGRDLELWLVNCRELLGEQLNLRRPIWMVDLVERQELGFVGESVPEVTKLLIDQFSIRQRIVRGHIDDVHQHPCSLDVA